MNEAEIVQKLNELKTVDEKIAFLEKSLPETEDLALKEVIKNFLFQLRRIIEKKEEKIEDVADEHAGIESLVTEVPSAPVIHTELKLEDYKAPQPLEETADELSAIERDEPKAEDMPGYLTSDSGEPYMRTEAEMRASMDQLGISEEEKLLAEYQREQEELRASALDTSDRLMSHHTIGEGGPVDLSDQVFGGEKKYLPKEDMERGDLLSTAREFSHDDFIKERDLIMDKLKYKRKDV